MEVGKISPYDLLKDFTQFYTEVSGGLAKVTRVLHNSDQIVRCYLRPTMDNTDTITTLKYWNMDGTPAAQFTMISGSAIIERVVDIAWSSSEDVFYAVVSVSGVSDYSIQKFNSVGAFQGHVIEKFSPPEMQGWYTARNSGHTQITTGESDFFVKVGGSVYRYPLGLETPYDDGSGAGDYLASPNAFYPTNGENCINFSYQSEPVWNVPSGTLTTGYLLYSWYDTGIQALYLRSISPSGTMTYLTERWALLDIPNYHYFRYPLFTNKVDPYALHYISCTATGTVSSGTCMNNGAHMFKVFNIDNDLAAFININVTDIVMPAGSGETSLVTAHVINCWGDDLEGKQVTYWVSSGDGQVIPLEEITDAYGISTAIFTAGPNIGMSQITAVVNEI